MPTIPYDEENRKFNTEDIVDDEKTLKKIFTKPYYKYVGSDTGCSCGFRHALLDGNMWFDVIEDDTTITDNSNHQNLFDFIIKNNGNEQSIEILACWEGDQNEPIKYRETIKASDILNKNFHFKERGLYTLEL